MDRLVQGKGAGPKSQMMALAAMERRVTLVNRRAAMKQLALEQAQWSPWENAGRHWHRRR